MVDIPVTLEQFARACQGADSDFVYELFEFGISQELRDSIYALASEESREPVREAMGVLGARYQIQALIDY